MTEQERVELGYLHVDRPEAEDVGEELMAAALDAGLGAADDAELDPEDQYDDEAVRVGRRDNEADDEEARPDDAGQRLSTLIGELQFV